MKALLLVLAGLTISTAQAVEPEKLTLACKSTGTGKATDNAMEPISMVIMIDFRAGKIDGFGKSLPAEIRIIDETKIVFSATDDSRFVDGNVDRITGDLHATLVIRNGGVVVGSMTYALKCTPT
jgi:hypothetical protein